MNILEQREMSVDNMADSLYFRFEQLAAEERHGDAISISQEWIVNEIDPQEHDYEFIFLDNFTLEV